MCRESETSSEVPLLWDDRGVAVAKKGSQERAEISMFFNGVRALHPSRSSLSATNIRLVGIGLKVEPKYHRAQLT